MNPVDDRSVQLLIQRVHAFHDRWRAKDWEATCDMLPKEKRKWATPEDKAHYCKPDEAENRIRLLSWDIQEIWVLGNRAKVVVNTAMRFRMWLILRRKVSGPREQYWIWEDDNWFVNDLIRWDDSWDDEQAIRVWARETAGS